MNKLTERDKQMIASRSEYLANLSAIINVPQLKSYYRTAGQYMKDNALNLNEHHDNRKCSKCLLYLRTETNVTLNLNKNKTKHYKQKLIQKLENKRYLTKYQGKQLKSAKSRNVSTLTCSTCKHVQKIRDNSQNYQKTYQNQRQINIQHDNIEKSSAFQARKRKRKHAGINQDAVAATKQQLAQAQDMFVINNAPITQLSKKMKMDTNVNNRPKKPDRIIDITPENVIDVDNIHSPIIAPEPMMVKHVPFSNVMNDLLENRPIQVKVGKSNQPNRFAPETRKSKKSKASRMAATQNVDKNKEIDAMRQQAKEIQVARSKQLPLATKKQKKKLKYKLRKLQDTIKNGEIVQNNNKPSLKDFLNSI